MTAQAICTVMTRLVIWHRARYVIAYNGEVCNFEAIGMNNTWAGHELSVYDRSALVFDVDMLHSQSKAGKVDPGLRA